MYSQLEYILKSIKKYPVHTLEVLPCGKLKLKTKVLEDFTIFKNLCKLSRMSFGLAFVFHFQAGEGTCEILATFSVQLVWQAEADQSSH